MRLLAVSRSLQRADTTPQQRPEFRVGHNSTVEKIPVNCGGNKDWQG